MVYNSTPLFNTTDLNETINYMPQKQLVHFYMWHIFTINIANWLMAGDVGLHEVPTTRNSNIGPQAVADMELWRGGIIFVPWHQKCFERSRWDKNGPGSAWIFPLRSLLCSPIWNSRQRHEEWGIFLLVNNIHWWQTKGVSCSHKLWCCQSV